MDESDKLSTAAITIALIALIIPLGQFVQQSLGTADGYRRCKKSVIGPWSKLRHRRWLWSEFRYETLYTTPEIALISLNNLDSKDMPGRSRKLGMMQPIVRNDGLVNDLTSREIKLEMSYRKSFWAYGYVAAFWAYLAPSLTSMLISKRKRQAKVDEAEKGLPSPLPAQLHINSMREAYIRQIRKRQSEAVAETVCTGDDQSADHELLVDWVPFLKALHQDHTQQWPGECACSKDPAEQRAWRQLPGGSVTVEDRSMPILFLRERSWDFIPPDVVRPVASIQVRALIVLATRLGMQWSGLDLKTEGGMSAQGNSFYLTSVSLRGLGTVIQFGWDGHTARKLGYIPSIAADKLLYGILPGCGDLCPEVKIVGDDRTQSLIGNLLDVLGLPGNVYESLASPEYRNRCGHRVSVYTRMVTNDAMILFCPFLPQEMCTSVYCYFYAWAGQNQMSTFHMWETRRALLVQLPKRIDALEELPKDHKLRYVNERLGYLETHYESDFYFGRSASLICYGPDEQRAAFKEGDLPRLRKKRRKFLSHLRKIFEQTQEFFDRLQSSNFTGKTPDYRIQYVDLVGANAEMCYFAGQEAKKRWESGKAKYGIDFRVRPWYGECYETTSCYVEFLDHNEHGLFANLRRRGYEMQDWRMEEAWWMLMLRGIVWDMSCNCHNPGQPIPSSLYDNQRPVWMM